jgi:hypothetical protein
VHVPCKASSLAPNDLIAGAVQFIIPLLCRRSVRPAGKLRNCPSRSGACSRWWRRQNQQADRSRARVERKDVKNYLSNIFQKLRITRRAQAASLYSKHQHS